MTRQPAKPPARRSRYSEAERERGLVALALCSGNSRRAAKLLADHGTPIPRDMLKGWPTIFADEYARVRADVVPRIKEQLAEEHTALAGYQIELSRKLSERLEREMHQVPARELSTNVRNLDVGSGIHTQRAAELRGDPTAVVEHRSAPERVEEITRKLKSMGIVIEGEAVEIEISPDLPDQSVTQ